MSTTQLLHSHPSQIDKTTLIKNLLDFSRSRDQRPPGSLLPKSKYPGNEVDRGQAYFPYTLRVTSHKHLISSSSSRYSYTSCERANSKYLIISGHFLSIYDWLVAQTTKVIGAFKPFNRKFTIILGSV